jgi:tRNA nucleotidyltransferase (CCA-adding enzyme)
MDEATLRARLERIEALFAGAATAGERVAAGEARRRILERLARIEREDPPVEFRFTLADVYARKVFLALLRRYELKPYRRRGQRHTTVMVRAPRRFVEETLWPEFQQLAATLRGFLDEVTVRVVAEVLHRDSSDATEVGALPGNEGEEG